jgi:predicted glycosyl hydrolase (DUF1957 family)
MIIGEDERLANLVSALMLVAAEPSEQENALPAFREIAEQIRRGEVEVALLDRQLAREGILPDEVAGLVRQIDETFDRLIEAKANTTLEDAACLHGERWNTLRQLAREALRALGIDWTRYRPLNPIR